MIGRSCGSKLAMSQKPNAPLYAVHSDFGTVSLALTGATKVKYSALGHWHPWYGHGHGMNGPRQKFQAGADNMTICLNCSTVALSFAGGSCGHNDDSIRVSGTGAYLFYYVRGLIIDCTGHRNCGCRSSLQPSQFGQNGGRGCQYGSLIIVYVSHDMERVEVHLSVLVSESDERDHALAALRSQST